MSGLGIRVYLEDDESIAEKLSMLALSGEKLKKGLDQIGFALVEGAQLRFVDGEDPYGQPWEPSGRVKAKGGQTMIDRGILRNSLTYLVSGNSVEYGTNIPYAPALHYGATIRPVKAKYLRFKTPYGTWAMKKEVKLPAREFLGVSEDDRDTILGILNKLLGGKA